MACRQPFTILRNIDNYQAKIRFCKRCKDTDCDAIQGPPHSEGGLDENPSKFSRLGTTVCVCGTQHQWIDLHDLLPYLSWCPTS